MSQIISDEQAIAIARDTIRGKVELSEPEHITIARHDDEIVVTFERDNPPGVRGADFDAQVTLDAYTGEVIEILGGP